MGWPQVHSSQGSILCRDIGCMGWPYLPYASSQGIKIRKDRAWDCPPNFHLKALKGVTSAGTEGLTGRIFYIQYKLSRKQHLQGQCLVLSLTSIYKLSRD
jgi:hypothetical protein